MMGSNLCLTTLSPGKFNDGDSLISTFIRSQPVSLRLDRTLDTQGVIDLGDKLILCHHQYHKCQKAQPVSFIDKQSGRILPNFLPNSANCLFPTGLALKKNILVVAYNGANFEGMLDVFDISNLRDIKYVRRIPLGSKQRRPMGLKFWGDKLWFVSYSEQYLWEVDLETGRFELKIDGRRYGLSTPIDWCANETSIFLSSHIDNVVAVFDRKYLLPIDFIRSPKISLPWSLVKTSKGIALGTLGTKNHAGSTFYKSKIYLINENHEVSALPHPNLAPILTARTHSEV